MPGRQPEGMPASDRESRRCSSTGSPAHHVVFCDPEFVAVSSRGARMLKPLFVITAIYLAGVGLALIFVPSQFGVGAVPEDASPELIALLRLLGGPLLGIAVLNWTSRNAEAVAVRGTVVLANIVGFGAVAANDIWGVISGEARDLAAVFLVVHLGFTLGFVYAWVRSREA
ncbi:hypothetical protein [Nocardia cyriacigeorgica]|uniref:hypothetical protein n=1 Tax=Nocardia cyriacigeorgica TaxID=135487 RepID=UPI003511D9A9